MKKENNDLLYSFQKTVFDSSIDLATDFVEIAVDEIITNELIEKIPIISTIVGIKDIVFSIKDLFFIKKTLVFIKKINTQCIDKDQIKRHKLMLESNPKKKIKELEFVMAIIDREIEYEKIELFAILYCSYISNDIICDWYDFKFCYDILNRLSLYDIRALVNLHNKGTFDMNGNYDNIATVRLSSDALIEIESDVGRIKISELGKVFYELALKGY